MKTSVRPQFLNELVTDSSPSREFDTLGFQERLQTLCVLPGKSFAERSQQARFPAQSCQQSVAVVGRYGPYSLILAVTKESLNLGAEILPFDDQVAFGVNRRLEVSTTTVP
jgi:hypothetical protein